MAAINDGGKTMHLMRPEPAAALLGLRALKTIATASGFSKAAVAWGPPPTIPVTEVPTPTPVGDVTDVMP